VTFRKTSGGISLSIGVFAAEGAIALTRTPGAKDIANDFVKPIIAALLALYIGSLPPVNAVIGCGT